MQCKPENKNRKTDYCLARQNEKQYGKKIINENNAMDR